MVSLMKQLFVSSHMAAAAMAQAMEPTTGDGAIQHKALSLHYV